MNQPEHLEQCAFFKFIRLKRPKYPVLNLVRAIPNGGHRHEAVGKKLKDEGVEAGTADVAIWIPSSNGEFNGAFIEFKAGKNKLTVEQKAFLEQASEQGYAYTVAYKWMDAVAFLERHLEINF